MQINNRTMILLIAAIIAVGTAVMVKNRLASLQPKTAVETPISNRILVAKRDLMPGNFINAATDIDWDDPKGDQADGNTIREGTMRRSDFNGGVVRKALKAGTPVQTDYITKAGDGGFLSAVLEPGMRAVAVAVNATTGAAGFIAPGDRVDLIVTLKVKTSQQDDASTQEVVVSETFVQDVRVVAVDQSLGNQENKALVAKNVTVEVNQYQAEQISVASEMGKISMALRSSVPDKNKTEEAKPVRDLGSMLSSKGAGISRVQAIHGNEKEDLQFYGGKH